MTAWSYSKRSTANELTARVRFEVSMSWLPWSRCLEQARVSRNGHKRRLQRSSAPFSVRMASWGLEIMVKSPPPLTLLWTTTATMSGYTCCMPSSPSAWPLQHGNQAPRKPATARYQATYREVDSRPAVMWQLYFRAAKTAPRGDKSARCLLHLAT
ncbi:hypothetical protein B0T25DRAFT_538583 [Lasiosphaeria hispida]|uniref:Uncharacterized protein n=1 Tax=Lasiosphaeria hispida TaxID=260671 RepID=A0AAJ0MFY6_9PEZI|nr:hypothetical protein B0T25DRAFT_538583 [Lasiosphaeria hispida]